ncbi:MAG: hypothetical protein ABT01_07840 [Clostridium sp. SCN 57-10]|nr:MAG: hypothetical protein ABT01_07840 [Clostridium sp. SCN 57-10]
MAYRVIACTREMLPDALRVERSAMGDHCYLADVYDYFATTKGELSCVFDGERLVGIGKFTVLWDGSGWLETLRVEQEWQRRGVGRAIYERYMEQARGFGCDFVRMYTGVENVSSPALARVFGLELAQAFREYQTKDFVQGGGVDFSPVDSAHAWALLAPFAEAYHGYVNMNRTYYRLNEATARGLAEQGMVYEDGCGSAVVLGARFQADKGLHLALLGGDCEAGLRFALAEAARRGVPRLVCNFAREHEPLEALLCRSGFAHVGDFITMEADLRT